MRARLTADQDEQRGCGVLLGSAALPVAQGLGFEAAGSVATTVRRGNGEGLIGRVEASGTWTPTRQAGVSPAAAG